MNTNFVDFGEVIMTPVIKDVENVIYHDDILEKIETFILNKKYSERVNIISVGTAFNHMLADFLKFFNRKLIDSVSFMTDNNVIIPTYQKFDYYSDTIVLDIGVNLNIEQLNLRICSALPYLHKKPVYVTLFKHEDSNDSIFDFPVKKYTGYGNMHGHVSNQLDNIIVVE